MHVIILRGISGSGKSTWAKHNHPNATVVSADHFFTQPDGAYVFDIKKLGEAHQSCFRKYLEALHRSDETIIVDNTNITGAEISPYSLGGQSFGASVELVTFMCDPHIAFQRKQLLTLPRLIEAAKRLQTEASKFEHFLKEIPHRTIASS